MRTRYFAVLLASLGLYTASLDPAAADMLKIGGTGSVSGALSMIGPALEAATGITLQVVPNLGSTGGNAAVVNGVLDICVAGRQLKKNEADAGLTIGASFSTPFGLVTPRRGPDELKSADIAEFYQANRPTWSDGNPVLIILRPAEEADTRLLGELFPKMSEAIAHLRTRLELSVAATDQDNADLAERTKGSVVGMSLTQVITEKRNLRFVSIDGVAPSLENLENGTYPYSKNLYFVLPAKSSPAAAAFLSFIATPEGETMLRQAGIIAGAK